MSDSRPKDISDLMEPRAHVATVSKVTSANASDTDEDLTEGRCRISRKPQMMLGFRKCNGEIDVLPYSMLARIRSEETSRAMTLTFPRGDVKIEGEHLTSLFHYLCEHRVLEIAESDRTECLSSQNEVTVTAITIRFGE